MPRGRKKKENNIVIPIRRSKDTESDMIAMSRDFNRALLFATDYLKWSSLQKKIFSLILGEIDWRHWHNDTQVQLNNEKVMKELGWDLGDNQRNMTAALNKELDYMVTHSAIRVKDPYTGDWFTGNVFVNAYGKLGITYVDLNPKIMPHVEGLYDTAEDKKKLFIQYVKPDLISFTSKFSAPLFSELCSCAVIGKNIINRHRIKIQRLRKLFDLSENDYTRKSSKAGSKPRLDKYNFEKRVLTPAVEDINNTEMLKLVPYEDGSYFKRIKTGAQIFEYEFQYIVLNDKEVYNHRKKLEAAAQKESDFNNIIEEWENSPDYLKHLEDLAMEYVDVGYDEEMEYVPETKEGNK